MPWRSADGVGFEPTVRVNVRQFSRLVPSTTRPPIRRAEIYQSLTDYGTDGIGLIQVRRAIRCSVSDVNRID